MPVLGSQAEDSEEFLKLIDRAVPQISPLFLLRSQRSWREIVMKTAALKALCLNSASCQWKEEHGWGLKPDKLEPKVIERQ